MSILSRQYILSDRLLSVNGCDRGDTFAGGRMPLMIFDEKAVTLDSKTSRQNGGNRCGLMCLVASSRSSQTHSLITYLPSVHNSPTTSTQSGLGIA